MSASVVLGPREVLALPETKPLDEAVWQTWVAKNRTQDQRNNAAFFRGVKFLAIAGLQVAAGFSSHPGLFDVAVIFIVAACAMVAMFHVLHARQFVFGALFAAVAVAFQATFGRFAERRRISLQ